MPGLCGTEQQSVLKDYVVIAKWGQGARVGGYMCWAMASLVSFYVPSIKQSS